MLVKPQALDGCLSPPLKFISLASPLAESGGGSGCSRDTSGTATLSECARCVPAYTGSSVESPGERDGASATWRHRMRRGPRCSVKARTELQARTELRAPLRVHSYALELRQPSPRAWVVWHSRYGWSCYQTERELERNLRQLQGDAAAGKLTIYVSIEVRMPFMRAQRRGDMRLFTTCNDQLLSFTRGFDCFVLSGRYTAGGTRLPTLACPLAMFSSTVDAHALMFTLLCATCFSVNLSAHVLARCCSMPTRPFHNW